MKRLFFKEEMRQAILAGKKTSTVRDHRLDLGKYKAVSGSRFHAKPFAVLDIIALSRSDKGVDLILDNYRTEGFESKQDAAAFLIRAGLWEKYYRGTLYLHDFKVVEKL